MARRPIPRSETLAVLLASAVYFVALGLLRYIDEDEGYFLYAARLVRSGSVPYRDFFFTQMPLIPWMYATLSFPAGGIDWISGRLITAALAVLAVAVFHKILGGMGLSRGPRLMLIAALLLSEWGREWAACVKVYTPTILFLLTAWLFLPGLSHAPPKRLLVGAYVSGSAAALAFACRLTVGPIVALLFAIVAWHALNRRVTRAAFALWIAGFSVFAAFMAVHYMLAPYQFVQGNWVYHQLGPPSPVERLEPNTLVLAEKLLTDAVWIGAILLGLSRFARPRAADGCESLLPPVAALLLIVAAFVPRISFDQHYCLATPWLLLWAARPLAAGLQSPRRDLLRAWRIALALLLVCNGYAALKRRYHPFGGQSNQELFSVIAACERIDENARDGERLLSWWPGYAVGARIRMLDGLENHFGQLYDLNTTDEAARRVLVLPAGGIEQTIRDRRAPIVAVGFWAGAYRPGGADAQRALLREAGYNKISEINGVEIYRSPD